MKGCFVTGTDTEVGKTFFSSLLTRTLRKQNTPALALKPFVCGPRTDAEELFEANDRTLTIDEVNPVWLKVPASPYAASMIEERPIDWHAVRENWEKLAARHDVPWIVEGVGGWLVPIDHQFTVREWAMELNLPVVIVCRAGLGTINHTLLTVESVRAAKLPILGLVINDHNTPDEPSLCANAPIIEQLTGLPILSLKEKATTLDLPRWLRF